MKFKKFFRVSDLPEESDDPEGWGVRVEPSKYLQKLHPHKAIAELQIFVNELKDVLKQYHQTFTDQDLEKPEYFGKMRKVTFELDVSESYLGYLKKHYKTIH